MRVGIVSSWFERGAAYVSMQFKEAFQSLGYEVFIYARGGEEFAKKNPKWDSENVTWNRFLFSPVPTDIDRRQFEAWIDDNKLGAVLFNEQQYWQPVLWAKAKKVTCIAYIDYYTAKTVPLFEVYDQLWCNTKRHYSVFQWHKGARYLPWGTDVEIFKPEDNKSGSLRKDLTFFHSAGSSPFRKGTDLVLKASDLLYRDGLKDFRLVIHTQVSLNRFFPELSSIITRLEKGGLLEIEHRTVGAPGLYHLGDVYVYPSRLEGIGLTIAEALACGLPVITTDEPPMTEFIDDVYSTTVKVKHRVKREDGYFWPMAIADEEDLAEKMRTFCVSGFQRQDACDFIRMHAIECLDFSNNICSIGEALNTLSYNSAKPDVVNEIDAHDRHLSVFYKSVPDFIRYGYQAIRIAKRRIFN